jgi:hypothetical protein
MLEALVVGFMILIGVIVGLFALVLLPLALVGLALKLLFSVILLPFRVVGWLIGAAGSVLAGLAKLVVICFGVCFAIVLLLGGALLLPLLPLLLIGGFIWLLARLLRPRAAHGSPPHRAGVSTV